MIRPPLTRRQSALLNYISDFVRQGLTPPVRELMRLMDFSRESSLTDALKILEGKGYVAIDHQGQGRQRVIGLTPRGFACTQLGLPIVGSIAAGPLAEAVQNPDEIALRIEEAVGAKRGDFALIVNGDSMIGDGILDGDKVLIRPGIEVQQGEIAAVQVAGDTWEATLKHVYIDGAVAHLRASNPMFEDIIVPSRNVIIAGVYRGLWRKIGVIHQKIN